MILAETVISITLLATAPRRPRDWSELHYISDDKVVSNSFEASNGMSLEGNLTLELENINGVDSVGVTQTAGSTYRVDVTMNTYDFSSYEKVIAKELELFDKNPGLKFAFNVTFAENATVGDSTANAA